MEDTHTQTESLYLGHRPKQHNIYLELSKALWCNSLINFRLQTARLKTYKGYK